MNIGAYVFNTSWIMAERVFGLGITFVVTVLVARYLGPADFGMLAYAIALAGLFSIIGHVGLDGLVVRDLVRNPDQGAETLGTALALKVAGYLIGLLGLIALAAVVDGDRSSQFLVVLIVGLSLLFKATEVFDFWFQAHVQAKYPSIARMIASTTVSALKIGMVASGATVLAFAVAQTIQAMLIALLLVLAFVFRSKFRPGALRVSSSRAGELLSQGWLVFLGSVFAVIYLRVDQVMLRWLADAEEVGVYAVAASLSEAWYFVPAAIVTSFFPRLIELRAEDDTRYRRRLQQLLDSLFIISFVVAGVISVIAMPMTELIFGPEYAAAGPILMVHIWASVFVFMRAAVSKWILIEELLVLSVVTQGCGAVLNVLLNWLLIPAYGGLGAAVGTLISYAAASYFSLLFHSRSRGMFVMMSKAMISPVRYVRLYAERARAVS